MNDIKQLMLNKAQMALSHAYAPYSQFQVAACIYTDLGNYYTGVNVENVSYGLTLCAEASAICAMVSAGEQHIKQVLIIAGNQQLCAPCGACRQRIQEFSDEETLIHLCTNNHISSTHTIKELLPLAFDFKSQ